MKMKRIVTCTEIYSRVVEKSYAVEVDEDIEEDPFEKVEEEKLVPFLTEEWDDPVVKDYDDKGLGEWLDSQYQDGVGYRYPPGSPARAAMARRLFP
jgi:hypothetical protein